MKCIRQDDVEVSKEVMDRYDLKSPEGRLSYILEVKEGFAPAFSNTLFAAMGGATEYNKVKEIMFTDIDEFLRSEDLRVERIDFDLLSEAKVYSLDGIFTTLTSLVDMTKVLKHMRRDREKLEAAFEKVEKNFILFVETLADKGIDRFSYADPSAMPEILGKHFEGWIVNRFVNLLNRLAHLDIAIHICPILFKTLKEGLKMHSSKVERYQETFLREEGFKVVGGSCIKNKKGALYYFTA